MQLNNIKPAEGSKQNKRRVVVGLDPDSAKQLAVVTRDKSPGQVVFIRSDLRVAKCHCNVVCLNVVLYQ